MHGYALEALPGFQPALQAVRLVTLPPQLLCGHRAGVATVAHGDHPGALGQLQSLHSPLVASVKGVVGVEVHASGYRALRVSLPLADVHHSDPLAALEHVPQGPRVDVVPLRHSPTPHSSRTQISLTPAGPTRPQTKLTAGSTPSPARRPPAPSGRWAPCTSGAPRTRRPRPPARRCRGRPGRRRRGTGPA